MNRACPVILSQLTSSTLRSIQFLMDAFCLRERDLLNLFAMETSQHQKHGQSKEHALILSYQLADLGRAFSDCAILQTFLDAEATLFTGSMKDVLEKFEVHILLGRRCCLPPIWLLINGLCCCN